MEFGFDSYIQIATLCVHGKVLCVHLCILGLDWASSSLQQNAIVFMDHMYIYARENKKSILFFIYL